MLTGIPVYVVDDGNEFLQLPAWSQVALDTQLLVYMAQKGVLKFKAEVEAVCELLRLPLDFVIGMSAFTEVQYVLMKKRVDVPGIIPPVSSLMVAACRIKMSSLVVAKSILIALVRLPLPTGIPLQSVKRALGWVTKTLKADRESLYNPDERNRMIRITAIEGLFRQLEKYGLAEGEGGRQGYKNDFRLVKHCYFQPYDARIIQESVGPRCHVFLSQDFKHGDIVTCLKHGVWRTILLWNPIKYGVKVEQ